MPTLPPNEDPRPQGAGELHRARSIAEAFGTDPERYDRTRPSYPGALIERLLEVADRPADVLEVGIGTGTAARQLRAAGCTVSGVEPDRRMADVARRQGFPVDVATFENWDAGGREFDAVVAAQSWHWVDPVAGAAKAAQVLRPGGTLALFWNVFDIPTHLLDVYRTVWPGSPVVRGAGRRGYAAFLDNAADGLARARAYAEPRRWSHDWTRTYARDEWLDQVPTFGGHTLLPPDTLTALLDGFATAIDAAGGAIAIDYTAAMITARRVEDVTS